MTSQRKRALTVAGFAVAFLTAFLALSGLGWQPALLAGGGMAVIAGLLVLTLHLVEANDTKAAEVNLARIRAAEEQESRRTLRGDLIA
jgi:hypothetical protein